MLGSSLTRFKVGGNIKNYLYFHNTKELQQRLSCDHNFNNIIPVGLGSNLLIRDGGINSNTLVILMSGSANQDIYIDGSDIICNAGASNIHACRVAARNNLGGFEFIASIPGSIGGGVFMNAGIGEGFEFCDIIKWVEAVNYNGEAFIIDKRDISFDYRYSSFHSAPLIITKVCIDGRSTTTKESMSAVNQYIQGKSLSQPLWAATAGSTFKNPNNHKAWKLIKSSGCEDLKIGGACVSEKHCNFIVNSNNAKAQDIEQLMHTIETNVFNAHNIQLEKEVRIVGDQ